MAVLRQEVIAQQNREVFRRLNAKFLRQQVNRVLLRVGRNYVRVVTEQVILLGCKSEPGRDFKLFDGVNQTFEET